MHTGSRGQGSRGRKDHGVGSPDHFSRHAKQNGNEMKQVMNHNKDNGLLNMIRRTDTMILNRFFLKTLQKYTLFLNHPSNFNKIV